MPNLVSLDKVVHHDLRVMPNKIDADSAQAHLIPLSLCECIKAATTLPIVFTKNSESGAFSLTAMTGFETGENLFFRADKWDGHYIPLNVRRQPFFAGHDEASKETILCLNNDSAALSRSEGERLFNDSGTETDYLKSAYKLVQCLVNDTPATEQFIQKMVALQLIIPVNLDIQFDDGEHTQIRGIYTLDDQIISELPDEKITMLHKDGFWAAMYAMIISMGHIPSLIDRRNALNVELANLTLT